MGLVLRGSELMSLIVTFLSAPGKIKIFYLVNILFSEHNR